MARKLPALLTILAISALGILAAIALTLPTEAAANKGPRCEKIRLKVSKKVVKRGGKVLARGACRGMRGGAHRIVLRMKTAKGWRRAGVSRVKMNGRFAKRIKINAPRGTVTVIKAKDKAKESNTASNPVRVAVTEDEALEANWGESGVEQTAEERGNQDCALATPGSEIGLFLQGCRLIASDTAVESDPTSIWGTVECQTRARSQLFGSGGDFAQTAFGAETGGGYRRMTVLDGDDFYGERCELGKNDHRNGPTAFYREGMRRATLISFRLPDNFPLDVQRWQTIMQMKQAQPSDAGGGVPILEMQALDNAFWISSDKGDYWSFPATKNRWIRFVFDVTYSQDPRIGSLQVSADLNGNGTIDEGERSPRFAAATLKRETDGPNGSRDGFVAGDSLPSHLRAGIYHDPAISCPPPGGCSVDVANVQVVAP